MAEQGRGKDDIIELTSSSEGSDDDVSDSPRLKSAGTYCVYFPAFTLALTLLGAGFVTGRSRTKQSKVGITPTPAANIPPGHMSGEHLPPPPSDYDHLFLMPMYSLGRSQRCDQ